MVHSPTWSHTCNFSSWRPVALLWPPLPSSGLLWPPLALHIEGTWPCKALRHTHKVKVNKSLKIFPECLPSAWGPELHMVQSVQPKARQSMPPPLVLFLCTPKAPTDQKPTIMTISQLATPLQPFRPQGDFHEVGSASLQTNWGKQPKQDTVEQSQWL